MTFSPYESKHCSVTNGNSSNDDCENTLMKVEMAKVLFDEFLFLKFVSFPMVSFMQKISRSSRMHGAQYAE